jgi:hypothetical protein
MLARSQVTVIRGSSRPTVTARALSIEGTTSGRLRATGATSAGASSATSSWWATTDDQAWKPCSAPKVILIDSPWRDTS